MRDTDVEISGDSLKGRNILLGISGGIAACDSVRLARELRRHGANLSVIMTPAAQKIITPLAIKWASQGDVITDWEGDLTALSSFDAVLVAPTTRNLMASFAHGLMNGPLLMALSAARGRKIPIMMIPSMHSSLVEDPITDDLVNECVSQGVSVRWGPLEEEKRKTPSHDEIVAKFANWVNRNSTSVVITIGATRSRIDDIRFVQNTSTGRTGFLIADHLYRHGMDITCVCGATSVPAPNWLPLIITTPNPDEMLSELKALAKDDIDVWIHSAAVLDYVVDNPAEGKIASLQGGLNIELIEGTKHISELKELCKGKIRIGFKLESGVKQRDLVHRALAQIEKSEMTATIANRLEDLDDPSKPRAHLVDSTGAHFILNNDIEMCAAILAQINNR